MKKIIVVCEYGWILCGAIMLEDTDNLVLSKSSVVRCWSNGKGIGGLAKAENKEEYTLDAIGDVVINKTKILFRIPCEW